MAFAIDKPNFQLKIVIFNEKRLSLNVEENQPMASLCYF
jgi:hypothetical protein